MMLTFRNAVLLEEPQLLDRLLFRISKIEAVDVAVAWIRRGRALDALLDFATAHPGRVRVLCGVNSFLTEPQALSAIRSCCDLKIAYGTSGVKLHSKMFVFRETSSVWLWVGSANLTESAFSTNREVVVELEDDGAGTNLFESYWGEFVRPDQAWMDDYANAYASVPQSPSFSAQQVGPPRKSSPIAPAWNDYVLALRQKNTSRLDWIASQLGEVSAIALKHWELINKQEAEKLLGIAKGYGGLGRLIGAGKVKNIFYDATPRNLKTRKMIGDALDVIPPNPNAPALNQWSLELSL
jgi:HKD family nuclease